MDEKNFTYTVMFREKKLFNIVFNHEVSRGSFVWFSDEEFLKLDSSYYSVNRSRNHKTRKNKEHKNEVG